MSAEKITGWFRIATSNPKYPDTLAFRCDDAGCGCEYYLLGDEKEPTVWCCGKTRKKPKEGWFNKLPVMQAVRQRGLTVLHGRTIDYGAEEPCL